MIYYTKIHFLEDPEYCNSKDYDCKDILGSAYNKTLKTMGKEQEDFFYEEECEYSKCGFEYEPNERYDSFFEDLGSKEFGDTYYKIVNIKYIGIYKDEIDKFQNIFFSLLKDKTVILWKFEDTRFLEIRRTFFEEVYNIEITLREVVSFIFLNTYYDDYNLLRDLNFKTINKNISKEYLTDNLENEFFYISFSKYKDLLNIKNFRDGDIVKLLEKDDDFERWKQKVLNRGVQKDFYKDFINSISKDLKILEQFRNAIMHHHSLNEKLLKNYENSKEDIIKKIDEFKKRHMCLESNDLDLVIGKEYKYIGHSTDNFIFGKKYKLIESHWGDTIFMGEKEKNPLPFWDKEFHQFWEWE